MAWRITQQVVKGVFDNRQKGLVLGTLWLSDRESPVALELHGNFLRDMAGCEITFENPEPKTGDSVNMDPVQIGMTGDMTASRKVNLIEKISTEDGAIQPEPVKRKANALYVEWFSESNGRVVIESTDFTIKLTDRAWSMNPDEEQAQVIANREAFRDWLEQLSRMEDASSAPRDPGADIPMNEFQWERFLRESDLKNEKLGEALEKYHGHPDSEKLIAREMGWTLVEEELEAQERGVFTGVDDGSGGDDVENDDLIDDDNAPEEVFETREPDAAREGIDWVRDVDGTIEHPLAYKALRFSAELWREFEDSGLLGETGDSRLFEWAGMVESVGIRLSGTLNDLAYGDDVQPGFVIAGLKRAVHQIHRAIEMLHQLEPMNLISRDSAKNAQKSLFEIRAAAIEMMEDYRKR